MPYYVTFERVGPQGPFEAIGELFNTFVHRCRAIEEENESTALMICDHLKDYIPQYFNS
jgi:hypothetical protein